MKETHPQTKTHPATKTIAPATPPPPRTFIKSSLKETAGDQESGGTARPTWWR